MTRPLIGALLIVVLARFLERRFDTGAPVRLALIGSRQLAGKLADELRANGISGYRVVGYITPDDVEPEPQRGRRRASRGWASWTTSAPWCSRTGSTCSASDRRPRACTCSRRPRGPASTSRSG